MTVLEQYKRLETTGLWREAPDAQRREVVVALGDATLMISNMAEVALTHWSLPAIARLNPGRQPALYAPGADTEERLEIEDPDMIAAIEMVRSAIEKRRPHPGRLRLWVGTGMGAVLLGLGIFWLPDALTRQTVALLPPASREAIGNRMLQEIGRLAGPICTNPRGSVALGRLSRRVFGEGAPPRVAMLPASIPDTLALPGGILVANAALVEDHETPEVLAGYLLAEDARRAGADPMLALLTDAGLGVTFRLLTTGEIDSAPLHAHAASLLSRESPRVPDDMLLARFGAAQISAQPYAFAQDITGETVLALIEASRGTPAPLLGDADWISLQDICGR
ncbi:hypothetical protein [Roseicyclus mahoneyensis]|jgi:hypothetical protein|uniref:Uncharacterized protein n=1 Tax=Roseicyclus mahoneyensis TaxID=164332 RepID=A0A316G8H1_9RHOB|nr:hypothetical protein [Roseicyclus mahoneyensis]PWK56286.1 hypothetical protein C7455_11422 [Roseicyclus mahoneyensis]